MGKLSVVVGGQFGSEAKGAVAGFLSSTSENTTFHGEKTVVCVRVGGPNAGHTVYGRCFPECEGGEGHLDLVGQEHPWRLRQVPVASVTNETAKLVVAAGSEVDFSVLNQEITQLDQAGYNVSHRLWIDESATVLTQHHIDTEKLKNLNGRLGSTAKGIGAARADRIMREAMTVGDITDGVDVGFQVDNTVNLIRYELAMGAHVVIEGTQGYGLGLHTKYYPKCTSGDTRAIDFLAQTGVSPWADYVDQFDVWVVARTRPIRVAGNSGPLKGETSWDELGLKAEKTTVTQKVRRVGEFDYDLVREAVRANGGKPVVKLALMMVDYEIPNLYGETDPRVLSDLDMGRLMELVWGTSSVCEADVMLVGTSPTTIMDLRR